MSAACRTTATGGTFITGDTRLAVTLPPGLTDEQAAAVTTATATAWYGLHELARINAGDRVLIHSATGGVGQAAIAIARAAGAEIFATAGSEQRRQLLRDMGIEHVYDSRSTGFAELITGYAPITGTPWLTAFAQHSPFAEAFRSTGQNPTGTSKLRAELDELPLDEWPTRLRRLISDQVSLILRRNVDPDRPLAEYGMDSLGALELRTRIETETGIRINSSDMTTTIRDLAGLLCEKPAPVEAA